MIDDNILLIDDNNNNDENSNIIANKVKKKGFKASITDIRTTGGKVFRPLQKNKTARDSRVEEMCSRFLYVSGYLTLLKRGSYEIHTFHDVETLLREVFEPFGKVNSVEFIPNRTYCFICFEEIESARKAFDYFNSNAGDKTVRVRYAVEEIEENEQKSSALPEPDNCDCDYNNYPSSGPPLLITKSLIVQDVQDGESEMGSEDSVHLWLNFVTVDEEQNLLREIDGDGDSSTQEVKEEEEGEAGAAGTKSEGRWLKSISRRVQADGRQ